MGPQPVVIAVEIGLPWKGLGVILQTGRGVEAASLVNTWDFVEIRALPLSLGSHLAILTSPGQLPGFQNASP